GSGGSGGGSGGSGGGSGGSGGGSGGSGGSVADAGGCACSVPGDRPAHDNRAAFLVLGLGLLMARGRRIQRRA
ncbi:MYXO-CTERM sorting domain-containing protein, partial [Polyangium sp. 6x1]|uniref:MYXO-CTERM sorting domain-containing protein n=1 Tax=Polyangium sp. 6x1 TaxID=3042689 RepID=UPI00248315D3